MNVDDPLASTEATCSWCEDWGEGLDPYPCPRHQSEALGGLAGPWPEDENEDTGAEA